MAITVTGTNDVPVCLPDSSAGDQVVDQSGTLTCTDADGDDLLYSKVTDPTNGGVTIDPGGDWTYDPDPHFNGVDDFTFRAGDGMAFGHGHDVDHGHAVNDAPACVADSSSGAEDADQTGTVTCTDAEGDGLTYGKAGNPANGTATVDANGDWTYSPDHDSTARTASRSAPTTAN